jgi:hypothetical protein
MLFCAVIAVVLFVLVKRYRKSYFDYLLVDYIVNEALPNVNKRIARKTNSILIYNVGCGKSGLDFAHNG